MTPSAPLAGTKSWISSRTIAGVLLVLLPLVLRRLGLQLDDAGTQALVEDLFQGFGSCMAIWGRLRAARQLTILGVPVPPAESKPSDSRLLGILILCLALSASGGCAADTRRGRVTNAVLGEVGRFAAKVVISSVANAAGDRAKGLKLDYAHSASEGLWQNAGTVIDSASVQRIVDAWTAGQLGDAGPKLASEFEKVSPVTAVEKSAVVVAMAQGISDAALSLDRPSFKTVAQ